MATEIRVFELGDSTARLEIPQDGDDDVVLYLFDPPMQQADGTFVKEKCFMLIGLDVLQTLLVELGNIPGITGAKNG